VLDGLSSAAADCRNAISVRRVTDQSQSISLNKVLLNRSLAEFAVESKQLYRAIAEIRTLRG
jgi:ribosomal protein L5